MRERKTNKKTQKSHEEIICCCRLVASADKLSRGAHVDNKKACERAKKIYYNNPAQILPGQENNNFRQKNEVELRNQTHQTKPQQNTNKNHALYMQSCGWVAGDAGLNAASHKIPHPFSFSHLCFLSFR